MSAKSEVIIDCPICKQKFNYYQSMFRPFCCERCQLLDLGKWLGGGYSIASTNAPMENDHEEEKEGITETSDDSDSYESES